MAGTVPSAASCGTTAADPTYYDDKVALGDESGINVNHVLTRDLNFIKDMFQEILLLSDRRLVQLQWFYCNFVDAGGGEQILFPESITLEAAGGSTSTSLMIGDVAAYAGSVQEAWLVLNQRGIDAANTLSLELDIEIGGTSIFSTLPKITQAAGGGIASTIAAAAGITVGVIDTAENALAIADAMYFKLTQVRTNPADTEQAGAFVGVAIEYDRVAQV